MRNCGCSESINANSKRALIWAKISPLPAKNFKDDTYNQIILNYCEHYCLLSSFHPVDCCPENHEQKMQFKFPIRGEITEISQMEEFDLRKMKEGWVLVENFNDLHLRSKVQLSFLRYDRETGIRNCYKEQQSIFNWIPVYRSIILDTGSLSKKLKKGQSMQETGTIENKIEEVNPSVC